MKTTLPCTTAAGVYFPVIFLAAGDNVRASAKQTQPIFAADIDVRAAEDAPTIFLKPCMNNDSGKGIYATTDHIFNSAARDFI
jgi:hypothetical protein